MPYNSSWNISHTVELENGPLDGRRVEIINGDMEALVPIGPGIYALYVMDPLMPHVFICAEENICQLSKK